jgi:hypothetical protein
MFFVVGLDGIFFGVFWEYEFGGFCLGINLYQLLKHVEKSRVAGNIVRINSAMREVLCPKA